MDDITMNQAIRTVPQRGSGTRANHDRQHLGVVLPAGTTLRIRQRPGDCSGHLVLRLLGDDARHERSVEVGAEWVDVAAQADLVPFIDTPDGAASPTVEVCLPPGSKRLPVFAVLDAQRRFLSAWDEEDAAFALLESHGSQVLVPLADRQALRAVEGGIRRWLRRVDRMLQLLEQEPVAGPGASPQRRFIKANAAAGGQAEAGRRWLTSGTASVVAFLDALQSAWGQGMPGESVGTQFRGAMRGLGDWQFFQATIDETRREIVLQVKAGQPHVYFGSTYAYASYRDAAGNELFSYDFIGTQSSTAMTRAFALSGNGGESLYVHHQEASTRYVVENLTRGTQIAATPDTSLHVLKNGIDLWAMPSEIGRTPTVQGNLFSWVQRNELEEEFSRLNIDLTNNTLGVIIDPVVSFDYLWNYTLSVIIVRDKDGKLVFSKEIRGGVMPTPVAETFSLQKGYTIQVTNPSPDYYAFLVNTETNVRTMVSDDATYQIIPRGLLAV